MKRKKSATEKYMDSIRIPVAPPSKVFKSMKDNTKHKKDYDKEYE